jgi:SprB repeat/CHU_C Type IX secretion signal domain
VRVRNCCPAVCTNPPTAAFCNSGGQPLDLSKLPCTGTEAGSWSLAAGPGVSSATALPNNQFDATNRTPGDYTLRYTLARALPAVCATVSDELVTVTKAPEAGTLAVPTLSFCDNKDTVMVLVNLITGEDPNGVWAETSLQTSATGAFTANTGTLRTNPLTRGSYTFRYTVPAVNGCPADAVVLTVQVASTPVARAGADGFLTCTNAQVALGDPGQAQAGVRLEWVELLKNSPIINKNAPALTVTEPGLYRLTARDTASGCFAVDSVKVTASQNFITDIQTDFTDPRCFGDNNGEISVEDITGGTPPFRYSLNGNTKSGNTFTRLKAGVYTLKVQDRDGCVIERTVELEEPPLVTFRFNADTTVFCGDPLLLRASPDLDSNLITSVRWFVYNAPVDSAKNLTLLVKPEKNIQYKVVLSDKNGCSATEDIRVEVKEEFPVFAPNIFKPESGGDNAVFRISGDTRIAMIKRFQVFDRGGSLVYEARNVTPNSTFGWDGLYRGRLAPPGVYVFQAFLEYCTGKEKLISGEVMLVR